MRTLAAIVFASALLTGCAGPCVEGTWVLVSRDLPDGGVGWSPDVMGCLSFADGRRNFNVYWKDAQGGEVSIASIAEYTLSDTEYSETNIYYMTSGVGAGVQYDLARQRGVSPVVWSNGRLEFKLPLHNEPLAVFESDHLTATRKGEFVDHWRRID